MLFLHKFSNWELLRLNWQLILIQRVKAKKPVKAAVLWRVAWRPNSLPGIISKYWSLLIA